MNDLLSLFPLRTVLFPGSTLPLQIFEPRYIEMIGQCIDRNQSFGVVLIKEGVEVGGRAEPFDVGTSAQIQNVLKFADGQMLLSAIGLHRFRIEHFVQQEPYLIASVTWLPDDVPPEASALTDQVRMLYHRHREALAHATGISQQVIDLPDDPVAVSYQLADQFRVVDYSKQQLLEADLDERLAAIAEALERELRFLPNPPRIPPQTNDGPWTLN